MRGGGGVKCGKYNEPFLKDKEKLLNDIKRIQFNTYSRKECLKYNENNLKNITKGLPLKSFR